MQKLKINFTKRQLQRQFSEHISKGPVNMHMEECDVKMNMKGIVFLSFTIRGEKQIILT